MICFFTKHKGHDCFALRVFTGVKCTKPDTEQAYETHCVGMEFRPWEAMPSDPRRVSWCDAHVNTGTKLQFILWNLTGSSATRY